MRNALSTLGVAITSVVASACVDPQGKLDEFAARVVDAKEMSQDCPGFTEIPDVSGSFFFAARVNQVDPSTIDGREPEIFFKLTLKLTRNPDKTGELDITAVPLKFEDKKEVGAEISSSAVAVDTCGRFVAPFNGQIPGPANPITLGQVDVAATLNGQIRDANFICGGMKGKGGALSLDLTTFGISRITGDTLPPVVVRCPE